MTEPVETTQHKSLSMMKRRCILLLARISLLLTSLILCLVALEIALRMGLLDQTKSKHRVWIPPHLKAIDRKIDLANYQFGSTRRFVYLGRRDTLEGNMESQA
jgi:hypothetical protein